MPRYDPRGGAAPEGVRWGRVGLHLPSMARILLASLCLLFAACSSSKPDKASPANPSPAQKSSEAPNQNEVQDEDLAVAYFAGGCFWGVEHYLEQLDGVVSVESGYMGGDVKEPTYEDVSSKKTGHLETVRVRFDPERVSYEEVTKLFFEIHDPTQEDGQGPDIGPQYRSAVFFVDTEQEATTRKLIEKLEARGYDVVTEVKPAGEFWAAEEYHQDYYVKTGKTPYCHAKVDRFGD